jgi:GDP-L-fucose synthase
MPTNGAAAPLNIVFDTTKPDGTPKKLQDVLLLPKLGFKAATPLTTGLEAAVADFRKR